MNRSIECCRPWKGMVASTCAGVAVLLACWSTAGADGVSSAIKQLDKSHKQATSIGLRIPEAGATLQDFCVNGDGMVVTLLARSVPYGAVVPDGERDSQPGKAEIRMLDRDGTLVRKWDVGFAAAAVGTGPDGAVYVGGDGQLASFDAEGNLLSRRDAPQTALLDKDELRANAQEQLEAEQQSAAGQIEQFEAILKDPKQLEALEKVYQAQLENSQEDASDEKQDAKKARPKVRIDVKRIYEQQLEALKRRKDRTLEQMIAMITQRLRQINAIAVGQDDVFIACPMSKGYGYAVWRTDRDFQNPKRIISGLSGCCGQMDIQTAGGEVFVAENSRHRVVRYDRDGKRLGSFGKKDREGAGAGFGGCCNPMNLCFAADGALLVAESNGVVKRFTPAGEYEGLVGVAKVPEGCKNSAIGISSDGRQVYYIDIQRSSIIILASDDSGGGTSESEK